MTFTITVEVFIFAWMLVGTLAMAIRRIGRPKPEITAENIGEYAIALVLCFVFYPVFGLGAYAMFRLTVWAVGLFFGGAA